MKAVSDGFQVFFYFIFTGNFYIVSFKFWNIGKCNNYVPSNVSVINLTWVENG